MSQIDITYTTSVDDMTKTIKVMKKTRANARAIRNELAAAAHLPVECGARVFDTFTEGDQCCIVMESCTNDLHALMVSPVGATLDEVLMRTRFSKIFRALESMHAMSFVHGDVKPNSILIDASGELKLCDFGHSERLRGGTSAIACGSPFCMAPELVYGKPHKEKIDVWAPGVVLFTYVAGRLPPDAADYYDYCSRSCLYPVDAGALCCASGGLVSMICGMLEKSTKTRLSIEQCLQSAWFARVD